MRFIIREQEYETLVAAGRLNYRTGILESWRLTEAVDGYRVMRVDLDRRPTEAASSTLWHALLAPDGRLERVKLRDFSPEGSSAVDVLVEGDALTISRADSAGTFQNQVNLAPGVGPVLPGLTGWGIFVSRAATEQDNSAVILDTERDYAPRETSVTISALKEEILAVTGQNVAVRPYLIQQDGLQLTVWLDEYGLPVRVDDQQGLLAIDDRYVRHR